MELETQLPYVVWYLFMTERDSEKAPEAAGIMKTMKMAPGLEVLLKFSSVILRAGEFLEDFLGDPERGVRDFGIGYLFSGPN